MTSRLVFIAASAALTLSGCSSANSAMGKKKAENTPVETAEKTAPVVNHTEKDLAGHWYISSVGNVKLHGYEDEWPFIQFESAEHRFYGSDGCNVMNGGYTAGAGQKLSVGHGAMTMRMCPTDPVPTGRTISETASFSITVNQAGTQVLSLRNAANNTIMTLEKSDIEFLNGAWQVVEIDGRKVTNPDVKLVIDVPEGRVHGNTGCNLLNGAITRDPMVVSSVQFSSLATTRMMCPPGENYESALLISLEEVYSGRRADNKGAELLSNSGKTLIKLTPLSRADF